MHLNTWQKNGLLSNLHPILCYINDHIHREISPPLITKKQPKTLVQRVLSDEKEQKDIDSFSLF